MPIGKYEHRKQIIDMTNLTFGRLTVLGLAETNPKKRGAYWECQCECGAKVVVSGASLRNGHTKSCGCYNRDLISVALKAKRRLNTYEVNGNTVKVYLDENVYFVCNLKDWNRAKEYTWFLDNTGYAQCVISGKKIRFHNFILNKNENQVIDHINQNKLDNRRENLRAVSCAINAQNISNRPANKSGCIGVYWNKNRKKWESRIECNGTRYLLGCFDSKDEAIKARKNKEIELNFAGLYERREK